jgi:hypothetical protein
LCDAVKVFVKGDPHKLSKIEEGRFRLIFSVSLVDNCIARLTSSLQNQTEINAWQDIPHKPGMGLNDPGLASIIQSVVLGALNGKIKDSDVSGWDWSVHNWELNADCDRRIALNQSSGTVFERVMRSHYYCVARKVMVLSDGTMYQQTVPGIMPSGWYNTSSTNCFMRGLDHHLIVLYANEENSLIESWRLIIAWIIEMGDDAVEREVPDAQEYYKRLGKTVKQYNSVTPEDFEFCSTRFVNGSGYPLNADKQLVNFLSFKPQNYAQCAERFEQFVFEMRHHPELDQLCHLIGGSGWWLEI